MTLSQLDAYFRSVLKIDECEKGDSSLNGIQVGSRSQNVGKVAFAVDACLQSFYAAREFGADTLFVHHGLFWGKPVALTDTLYERIAFLTTANISLYAAHLPLDMHEEVGNNAAIAHKLGLSQLEPFGAYRGLSIGWKGVLPKPLELEEVLAELELTREDCLSILPFGKKKILKAGIIAGGAPHEIDQAIEQQLDLYITGDASHIMYHQALEGAVNVICGGHYNTEVWGCRLMAEKCAAETGLATEFLSSPTGL